MQLLAANNAASTLADTITNVATSANLQAGTGALFPTPGAGQYFVLTFTSQTDPTDQEVVWVTGIVGDTITMTRAQEGTSAQSWDANDLADNMMTAGQLETLVQQYQAQQGSFNFAVDTGSVDAYLCAFTPAVTAAPPEGFPARVLIANTNTGPSTINFGWGNLNIVRRDLSDLIGGELMAGQVAIFNYDGTHAQLQGIAPATDAAASAGTDTESAITPAQLADALGTGKLLSGQCLLQFTSATQLTLVPYNGNNVPNAGSLLQLPAAGLNVANTVVTVNGTPGASLAASTVYLVALNAASQLEFWTLGTGHGVSATTGNIGVEIITGHNDKTLVGMVATNVSSQFSAFLTRTWFNRIVKKVNQTDFTTNRTTTSVTVAEVNAEIRNSVLVWVGETVDWSLNGEIEDTSGSSTGVLAGVAFDGIVPEPSMTITATTKSNMGVSDSKTGLSEGLHYATLVAGVTTGETAAFKGPPPYTLSGASIAVPTILSLKVMG